jgi:FMN phosphatase YigB (HAD superfamily)
MIIYLAPVLWCMDTGYIFDLDFCIADPRTMGEEFIDPLMRMLKDSNYHFGFEVSPDMETQIRQDLWSMSLDRVVRKHNIPNRVANAICAIYRELEAPNSIAHYGDLNHLGQIDGDMVLVTTGFYKLQRSKIAKLSLHRFLEAEVDAIDMLHPGKKALFAEIANRYGWRKIYVVGDGHVELDAARELGMVAIQTLRPDVKELPADYHITTFEQLGGIQ